MTDYRAYAVWPDGNFEGFKALICVDDNEAVNQARYLVDKGAIELWSCERFITRYGTRGQGNAAFGRRH